MKVVVVKLTVRKVPLSVITLPIVPTCDVYNEWAECNFVGWVTRVDLSLVRGEWSRPPSSITRHFQPLKPIYFYGATPAAVPITRPNPTSTRAKIYTDYSVGTRPRGIALLAVRDESGNNK